MSEIASVLGGLTATAHAASPGSPSAYQGFPLTTAEESTRADAAARAAIRRANGTAPAGPWAKTTSWSNFQAITADLLRIRRIEFGSPLGIELALPSVFETLSLLIALIYATKRLYGFDLELLAHREEMRTRFEQARREAGQFDPWTPELSEQQRAMLRRIEELERILESNEQRWTMIEGSISDEPYDGSPDR